MTEKTINLIFDFCVELLVDSASFLGISYQEINVWLFVVAMPGTLLASIALNVVLLKKKFNS